MIIDSDTFLGINTDYLNSEIERLGGLVEALLSIADTIDIGDGGVEHEGCIVPDLRIIAYFLESRLITEDTFWLMMHQTEP